MFTPEQQQALLEVARASVMAAAKGEEFSATTDDPALQRPAAAFVTLHKRGQLRGCIGMVEAEGPLIDTICDMAHAAASHDPRFRPVRPDEVPELRIEISVLTPAEAVTDCSEIEVGLHGLIVEKGRCRGLLLPQVPEEWGWDREEFLDHTCVKAGLPKGAWKDGAQIYRFCAEVFGE